MPNSSSYKILGIKPGAEKAEIKKAYRALAKKYHPDKNNSPDAAKKFHEVNLAYNDLCNKPDIPYQRDVSYKRANDTINRERERARARARAAEYKSKIKEENYKKSALYNVILLLKYFLNGLVLLFSIVAIIGPIMLGVFVEPVAFFATIYFEIIGAFLIWHIWVRRKTWFSLGKFNFTLESILKNFHPPVARPSNYKCYYMANKKADGKAYAVDLVKILNIRVSSFGAMDHGVKFKRTSKKLYIPRSLKAQNIHRICSFVKVFTLIMSTLLLPFSSIFWRFIAGICIAGTLTLFILMITKVKGKTSYLFTPFLLIKVAVWLILVSLISKVGPGFNIALNEYRFILFAGLLFLTDMLFDLIFGFFPFYKKLFKPIIRQGNVLTSLYSEGYQNYIEYPVYSIFYPLIKWIV